MSITIEQDLKEILDRIERKIDKQSEDLNSKIDKQSEDLNSKIDKLSEDLNSKIDKQSEDLNSKIDKLSEDLNSKIDKQSENLDSKIDKLSEDVHDLKLGQVDLKGDIKVLDERLKGTNTRLDKVEISMQKIPELAEKVGEVKNWRQLSLIIVSATIAAILGYFVRSGKL